MVPRVLPILAAFSEWSIEPWLMEPGDDSAVIDRRCPRRGKYAGAHPSSAESTRFPDLQ